MFSTLPQLKFFKLLKKVLYMQLIETDYNKIINYIAYENNQRYKLFLYFKNDNLKDKYIMLINYLNSKFSKILDFYDISDYLAPILLNEYNEIILLKNNDNKTVISSSKIEIESIENYLKSEI